MRIQKAEQWGTLLLAGVAVGLLLVAFVFGSSVRSLTRNYTTVRDTTEARNALAALRTALFNAHRFGEAYHTHHRDDDLRYFAESVTEVQANLEALDHFARQGFVPAAILQRSAAGIGTLLASLQEWLTLPADAPGERAAELNLIIHETAGTTFEPLNELVAFLAETQTENLVEMQATLQRVTRTGGLLLGACALLVTGGAVLFRRELATRRATVRALARMNETLESQLEHQEESLERTSASLDDALRSHGTVVERLTDSEARYRTLFRSSPMAIVILDPDTQSILGANSAAELLLERTEAELTGQSFDRLLSATIHTPLTTGRVFQTFESGEGPFTWNLRRRDATTRDIEVVWKDVELGGRRVQIAFLVDVTPYILHERQVQTLNRTLEQKVSERTAALQAAVEELQAFTYTVSHDLRAPLRSIDGFSRALLEDYSATLEDGAQGYLRRILRAAKRMGNLIDDLLGLSRITRAELSAREVNLSAIAEEAIQQLQTLHPRENVDVRIASGLTARADARLIRIALDNLFANSWKFTGPAQSPVIEFFACGSRKGQQAFTVRDNGVGFPPEFSAKLFHPFQRLHSQSEFEGTGIGLATVRRIIQRHGGEVWAEGTVGEGASISFSLPE